MRRLELFECTLFKRKRKDGMEGGKKGMEEGKGRERNRGKRRERKAIEMH